MDQPSTPLGKFLRSLSVTNILLWVLSSVLVSVITSRYTNFGNGFGYDPVTDNDFVFAGLWAGLFYGIAGLVGMCSSYAPKSSRLKALIVLHFLALAGSLTAAGISGTIGVYITTHRDPVCYPTTVYPPIFNSSTQSDCITWFALEFTLLGCSVVAAVVNLIAFAVDIVLLKRKKLSFLA